MNENETYDEYTLRLARSIQTTIKEALEFDNINSLKDWLQLSQHTANELLGAISAKMICERESEKQISNTQ